ncbi:beta-lactamase family protein [candidate division KSB1 bacterium]|nr:beta-lactamase family protein [candidate division KSB1 bacterium]
MLVPVYIDMSFKKIAGITAIITLFVFFDQFLSIPPDSAILYPGKSGKEATEHIESLIKSFYSEANSQTDELLTKTFRKNAPGAAIAVIQNGKILFKKGYGLANLNTREPIETNTRFLLASVSKQFTAMAIMMLEEEGRLSFEDSVSLYFPEVPSFWKKIKIKHLLTHTSGIPDRFYLIGYAEGYLNRDILDRLIQTRYLDFNPGARFKYSNSGYNLLAMIVEMISGKPFRTFLKERIFDPVGMIDTIVYDETEPVIENRAIAYAPRGRGYRPNDFLLFTTGASGIFSSVEDLFKWDQTLYTEQLVSAKSIENAFTPHVRAGRRENYGFGWRITNNVEDIKAVYHTGSLGGAHTILFRVPEKNFSIILLANRNVRSRKQIIRKITEIYHPGLIDILQF